MLWEVPSDRQHSPALPLLMTVSKLMISPVVVTAITGRAAYTGRPVEGDARASHKG
jgi:hypothetical protein